MNFFLLAVGLFLFVQTTFHPLQRNTDLTIAKEQVKKIPDVVVRERRLAKLERSELAVNFVAKHSNTINFIVTPIVAFFFFAFYYKARFNYTGHLVTNLYMAGFIALVFIVVIAPFLLLTNSTTMYYAAVTTFLLFEIFYHTVTYYADMERRGVAGFSKALPVSLLTVLLWVIASSSAINWYVNSGANLMVKPGT